MQYSPEAVRYKQHVLFWAHESSTQTASQWLQPFLQGSRSLGGVRKKGPRKRRPQLEKTSTEITSTRKRRSLGNKVHLERVWKKGNESRKIGSISKNKAGFYRSFNAIFGKIGRCASEEVIFAVIFALIKTRCLPVLLYGTEVCPTNAADLQSMQFTINRVIIKLFKLLSRSK